MKRLYTVKNSFWADAVDPSDRGRTFYQDETLWWDTEQTIDPAVFEVDASLFFQIPRSEFLRCIQVVTPEGNGSSQNFRVRFLTLSGSIPAS